MHAHFLNWGTEAPISLDKYKQQSPNYANKLTENLIKEHVIGDKSGDQLCTWVQIFARIQIQIFKFGAV